MTITLPAAARFTARVAFADRLCQFYAMRNSPHRPTRVVARASIRQLVRLMRQLQP
jgi:hypothetical protein